MDLYREGFLNKAGKGLIQAHFQGWRPRYFILDGTKLKYYKSREILPENLLGCIHLADIESVGLMKNEKNNFQITTKSPKSRTYYMSGRSEDEAMGWVRVIELGRARLQKKNGAENAPNAFSVYDEVKPPSQSLMGPTKPPRMEVPSEYSFIGPASPSSSPTSSSTNESQKPALSSTKPVPSEYETVGAVKDDRCEKIENSDDDETFTEDPTYERVKDVPEKSKKPSSKTMDDSYDNPNSEADLYDSIDKNDKEKPTLVEPPPLPSRHPSSSQELASETSPMDGTHSVVVTNPEDESTSVGFYNEIHFPPTNDVPPVETKAELVENNPDNLHVPEKPVYAKPIRKRSSKRKLNPAMMDIGEVSIDIEDESAGKEETLKKGMTQPIGQRFAIEELREILNQYNEDANHNNINGRSEAKVIDFDVKEGESAFDVLKRFLEQHQ